MIKPRHSLVFATVFAVTGVAILLGLCKWQIDRHIEKQNLIAATSSRLNMAPSPLPAAAAWPRLTQSADEYRRVTFSATCDNAKQAPVFAGLSLSASGRPVAT